MGETRKKIGVLCLPGLENFLPEIVAHLAKSRSVRSYFGAEQRGIEEICAWADIVWIEWANELAVQLTGHPTILKDKRVICRLHSYEALSGYVAAVDWEKIDDVIFVAEHVRSVVVDQWASFPEDKQIKKGPMTHVVPNGIDLGKFLYKQHVRGTKIAALGNISHKKGPMMLLHAFHRLYNTSRKYKLYIGGETQDFRYMLYFRHMIKQLGMQNNVFFTGKVDDVPKFFEDKNFVISTSPWEGCPVALMEAMAMGVQPLIHNFVGAEAIFPKHMLWNTPTDLLRMVKKGQYDSKHCREFIERSYSLEKQLQAIDEIIDAEPVSPEEEKQIIDKNGEVKMSGDVLADLVSISSKQVASADPVAPVGTPVEKDVPMQPLPELRKESAEKALRWLKKHCFANGAIVSNKNQTLYPEVTGYLIPTLLKYGEADLARGWAEELQSAQQPDGSYFGPDGKASFAFDTAQVVRGLVALDDVAFEETIYKACNWILENSSEEGQLPPPKDAAAWSMGARGAVPELVHLYCLKPMYDAGELLGIKAFTAFANRSSDWYGKNLVSAGVDFKQPGMMSHFFCYIMEALVELKFEGRARKSMAAVDQIMQDKPGFPAWFDVSWVCSPGQAQAALVWAKLGELDRAKALLSYMQMLQANNGGFYGSYGMGAEYFPAEQIPWAVKFYLDAFSEVEQLQEQVAEVEENLSPEKWNKVLIDERSLDDVVTRFHNRAVLPWLSSLVAHTESGKAVLELGSGTGELSAGLAAKGRQVTLLDFSEESLSFSQRLFEELGLEGRFEKGDVLESLPFADDSFDCVFSSGLLEHFNGEQIEHIMAESARVSEGKVISMVPNASCRPYMAGKKLQEEAGTWKWGKEEPKNTMKDYFQTAGLETIDEFSVAQEHALRFIYDEELREKYRKINEEERQGYLLVTVGKKEKERKLDLISEEKIGTRQKDLPISLIKTTEVSKDTDRSCLVVVPNDPLQAYVDAGYSDQTEYFNPLGFWNEVYCLSPYESEEKEMYGMHVVPTAAAEFVEGVKEVGADLVRIYDMRVLNILANKILPDVSIVCSVHDVKLERVSPQWPKVDYFIAMSGAIRDFMTKEIGVPADRIYNMSNRVDMVKFRYVPASGALIGAYADFRNRFPGDKRILHVGRRDQYKNLETVIKALAKPEMPSDYVLLAVGKGDNEKYEKLAKELGVADRCFFIESVPNDDLPRYYSWCDCLCNPSRVEGFGIVFIEALACGAAVVSTDIAPMNEFISSDIWNKDRSVNMQKNGFLVTDCEDSVELARAVVVACEGEQLKQLAERNARGSVKKFSKEAVDKAEVEIYKDVLRKYQKRKEERGRTIPVAFTGVSKNDLETRPLLFGGSCEDDWKKIAGRSDDAWLYHTYEEQLILKDAWNAESHSFLIYKKGEPIGIFPLQRHMGNPGLLDSIILGSGGLALIEEDNNAEDLCYQHLESLIRNGVCNAIKINLPKLAPKVLANPYSENPLLSRGFADASTKTGVLRLDKYPEEVMYEKVRRNHKRDIKWAKRHNTKIVVVSGSEAVNAYYALHKETYAKSDLKPHPIAYFQQIDKYFRDGRVASFQAWIKDRLVAVANVAVYKGAALYWTAANTEEAYEKGAQKLLLWKAMMYCKGNGVKWFEIGEKFDDPKVEKHEGLSQYKTGWGEEEFLMCKGVLR